MANLLTEYEDIVNDPVKAGIAETIVIDNPLMRVLPHKGITSNTIKYKMETAEAVARGYEVGEEWVESTGTWAVRYADLMILGDDADTDKFIISTMGAQENIEAENIKLVSKAVSNLHAKLAIMGKTTSVATYSSSKNMKGLLRLIAECESETTTDLDGGLTGATSTANNDRVLVRASNASGALTLAYVDELLDMVRPNATHLLSSRAFRRKMNTLAQAAGTNLEHDKGILGMPVTRYGEVEILVSDGVFDNLDDPSTLVTALTTYAAGQTRAATNDITPVFALRIGEDGFCGITSAQNGMLQVESIGTLQNKDAIRTRVKFYCGLALFNKLAAAVMTACCMTD